MLSKNQIKFIRSLEQKKFRRENGLFVAEGKKIVNEILNSGLKIHSVYIIKNWRTSPPTPLLKERGVTVVEIDEKELEQISFLTTPNEVLCIAEIPKHEIDFNRTAKTLSLLLDNIKDPGNFGTIIRIADWFGIENIFCTPECVDAYNPKVVQATMGSIARVKVYYEEGEKIIKNLTQASPPPEGGSLPSAMLPASVGSTGGKGDFLIYAASLYGKNIYKETLSQNGLLILGNESEGISEKNLSLADEKISIPQFGKAESLNVAVSAAVIISEFRRRNYKYT